MIHKNYFILVILTQVISATDPHNILFSKLLEHDETTGLLPAHVCKNQDQLLKALASGNQKDFNAIQRCPGTQRVWANPQAAFARLSPGFKPSDIPLGPPPALSSAQAAADLIELYLMADCSDIPFEHYNSDSKIKTACSHLNRLGSAYKGPKKGKTVTPSVIFRGNSSGDLIGPYVSQFIVQSFLPLFPSAPTDVGAHNFSKEIMTFKRHIPVLQKREFGVSWQDFVALQNGKIPKKFVSSDCNGKQYPNTGRDMACFVYTDVAFDPYYFALQVLACHDFPMSAAFPYEQKDAMINESSGTTMGLNDVYSLLGRVCWQAYALCWYYKWRVYMRLRPEAMAGLLHYAVISGTNEFNLHASLFQADLLEIILKHNQLQSDPTICPVDTLSLPQASTYLLPQKYPEGSPTHPSYPAAHATIAGACTTLLKAMFNENIPLSNHMTLMVIDEKNPQKLKPYKGLDAKRMTVGSELDKLASNVAYGRSWAGIHFRSDNEAGLKLGEEVAIATLREHAKRYHEKEFKGFQVTKRDGTLLRITRN